MCCKCGEKYSPEHRCTRKQLNMVLVEELSEEDGEEYLMYVKENEGIDGDKEEQVVEERMELSINPMKVILTIALSKSREILKIKR